MKRIRKLIRSDRGVFEPAMSEEDVLGQIRAMLEANGARVYRSIERIPYCPHCHRPVAGRASEAGIPDLWGWFPKPTLEHPGLIFPLHFFVEVKSPGEGLRPAQAEFIAQATQDGVIAFRADSWSGVVSELWRRGIKLRIE